MNRFSGPDLPTMAELLPTPPTPYEFETLPRWQPIPFQAGRYEVAEAVQSLADCAQGGRQLSEVYWRPSVVLQAIMESGFCAARKAELTAQITQATVELYAGVPNLARIERLENNLKHRKVDEAVSSRLDDMSVEATLISRSAGTALDIARACWQKSYSENILMLPLCYGGYAAGIQTYLLYGRQSPESIIYPIRYSHSKDLQRDPQVTGKEVAMLRHYAKDRTVVIVDDDAYTGRTLIGATSFFRSVLKGSEVIGFVNTDKRPTELQRRQGLQWEGPQIGSLRI